MAVVVGLRVLRGPDWSGNDEDGGEGYLGTVVKLLGNQEVHVLWDIGQESTCSAGLDGKFELRIFDSAQVGIRHRESCCANCGESGIFGMLWRCQECSSNDLCSLCYSKDAHDLRHAYLRIDKPGASGQPVPKRKLSVKCRAIGIFPGSKVIRGKDWQWGDQDGGQGTEGVVKDYENVSPDCSRNLMLVVWPNGESNSYRLGFRGSVDLKCVEEELGPYYYRDHLPLLDLKALEQHADQQDSSVASKRSPCPDATSSEENAPDAVLSDTEELSVVVGDRVAVKVEAETLRELQKDCGGCTASMIQCIGLTGEVTNLSQGTAFVHFSTSKVSYRFNMKALIKVLVGWNAGDTVRIRANNELLRILNRRLGWNTSMDSTLNKVGRIVTVNEAGDLEVDIEGHRHHFSPACCLPASTAATEEKSSSSACAAVVKCTNSGGMDTVIQPPVSIAPGGAAKEENNNMALFQKMREMVLTDRSRFQHQNIGIVGKMLFAAVEQDDTAEIRNLCRQCPALVNDAEGAQGLTPLIYGCLRGRKAAVLTLLDLGADINKCAADDSKKTPLSAAMEGKDTTLCDVVVERGAKLDIPIYGQGQTAIHLAVTRNLPSAIKVFARHGADMNSLNIYGDTPLHQAIENMKQSTLETLIALPQVDIFAYNRKGFNAFHLACYVDNPRALELLIERDRSRVDEGVDGRGTSGALHIASANNHINCIRLLLINGGADVNKQDNKGMTGLHMACHQGNLDTVETLLELGAEVNIADRDMDTPLHLAIGGKIEDSRKGEKSEVKIAVRIQISTMLISRGAFVDAPDNKGKTPLHYGHQPVREGVKMFMDHNKSVVQRCGTGSSERRGKHYSSSLFSIGSSKQEGCAPLREVLKGVGLPCGVCGTTQSDITLHPCQHKCVCSACSAEVVRCPLCNDEVRDKVNTGTDEKPLDLQTAYKQFLS